MPQQSQTSGRRWPLLPCCLVAGILWLTFNFEEIHSMAKTQQQQQQQRSITTSPLALVSDNLQSPTTAGAPAAGAASRKQMGPIPPTAILHLGPRKTATTTIQHWLKTMARYDHLLRRDRLTFRGHKESGYSHGVSQYFRSYDSSMCVSTSRAISMSQASTHQPKQSKQSSQPNYRQSSRQQSGRRYLRESSQYYATRTSTATSSDTKCDAEGTIQQSFDAWKRSIHEDARVHHRHVLFSDEDIPRLHRSYLMFQASRQSNSSRWYHHPASRSPNHKNNSTGLPRPRPVLHIIRDEVLSDYHEAGNLRITATYRRYFDWLYSEYQQEMKTRHMFAGHPMYGFVEWYRLLQDVDAMKHNHTLNGATLRDPIYSTIPHHLVEPLSRSSIDEWEQIFQTKVQIYNMHTMPKSNPHQQPGTALPLPLHWLCETIPDVAQHTCEQARLGNLTDVINSIPEQEKSSDPLYRARRIAWHAVHKKRIKFKRSVVAALRRAPGLHQPIYEAIQQKLVEVTKQHSSSSTPTAPSSIMACLAETELQQLWSKSVQIQREIVPEYHQNGDGSSDIEAAWQKALSSSKFCDVDLDNLFSDGNRDGWQALFDSIASKYNAQYS
eukprot:CAMPEP_0198112192 /NCGR_PEP_ID=MMETSP1442-20131203/4074_1 /TAXON_ID= /ORGANISM="Craspedostauros australis, Strain CCMP3328" /LENGTH=608 /DNA_ID=CAMNT_0043768885 /DNA_START=673 /DNA_END=2499 /DNA_ORIENTATION=+